MGAETSLPPCDHLFSSFSKICGKITQERVGRMRSFTVYTFPPTTPHQGHHLAAIATNNPRSSDGVNTRDEPRDTREGQTASFVAGPPGETGGVSHHEQYSRGGGRTSSDESDIQHRNDNNRSEISVDLKRDVANEPQASDTIRSCHGSTVPDDSSQASPYPSSAHASHRPQDDTVREGGVNLGRENNRLPSSLGRKQQQDDAEYVGFRPTKIKPPPKTTDIGQHSSEGENEAVAGKKEEEEEADAITGEPLSQCASVFAPTAVNPLHAHLEALVSANPRFMAEAPPDCRLSAISYQIAGLEEQLRLQVCLCVCGGLFLDCVECNIGVVLSGSSYCVAADGYILVKYLRDPAYRHVTPAIGQQQ